MCPSLTIALNMSVIQSAAASPDAVSISDTRPEGPAALPAFALAVAARSSSTVISSADPLTGFASSKPSLFQSNSSFNKFSKCSFHFHEYAINMQISEHKSFKNIGLHDTCLFLHCDHNSNSRNKKFKFCI